ncbi:MAG: PKD domain-containing protein [Thermoplasmatota archaeon]
MRRNIMIIPSMLSKQLALSIAVAALLVSTGLGTVPASNATGLAAMADGYENISVGEAWEMLNDTSNGIQIPIDVRTTSEWTDERINSPFPEFPRHVSLSTLGTEDGMTEFKSRYTGEEVIVYCRSGGRSASASQLLVDEGFEGTIYNMEGGILAWRSAGYPTRMGDTSPGSPQQPDGPREVHAGYEVSYSTSAADPDGDPVRYGWDWDGDGEVDEWTSYYQSGMNAAVTRTWTTPGAYQVRVKSEDNSGDQSQFSSMLMVTVDDKSNTPPEAPVIDGPSQGRAGESYEFTFTVIDSDDDQVYIWVEWGGGCPAVQWCGPYDSGEAVTLTNIWNDTGTYTVKAMARDIYGNESNWGTLEVTMPLSYASQGWSLWGFLRVWFAEIMRMTLPLSL